MNDDELVLRAAIRDELSGPLEGIRDEVRGLGRDADDTGRRAASSSRGFNIMGKAAKLAAGVAVAAFGAALAGGYALLRLGKSAYDEAMEARKVGAVTDQVIKSTGASAWTSSKQVGALASSLSAKIGVDDEAIQSAQNLLLTFKQVRNELGEGNRIFDRATAAATDLASIPGFGDLASSAKMLGKALNDPLKGLSAMGRAGVTFTQDQQDRVKWLVENNRLLDAQKIILGEVESQVGGTAAAQATWADKASVAWGNLQERLGTSLLPVIERVSGWFVREGAPALDGWIGIFERRGIPAIESLAGTWLPRLKSGASDAYDTLKPLAEQALPTAADVIDRIAGTVKWLAPKLADVFEGFNGLPGWAKTAIIAGAGAGVVGQKLGIWQKLLGGASPSGPGGLLGAATKARPIPVIVMNDGFGDLPGGKPGSSPTGGTAASTTSKVLKYGGVLAIEAAAVTLGAEKMGEWLGNRPWKMDGRDPDYERHLPAIVEATPKTPVYTTLDPMTGLPTFKTNVLANGNRSIDEVQRAAELLKSLPTEVRTEIRVNGAPESRREAVDLAKTYDLTKSERITLFRTQGIPLSSRETADLLHLYDRTPRELPTVARFDSALAEQRLASYRSKLDALMGAGTLGVPARRESGGHVKAGRGYLVGESRAEWFVPRVDGYIKPRVPELAATAPSRRSASAGREGVQIESMEITVNNPAAEIDVKRGVADGIEDWLRDYTERGRRDAPWED